MTMVQRFASRLALAGLVVGAALPALAQSHYPDKPIRMIVPYSPGGQFDIHARALAIKMQETLGQSIIIENKPGGATTLGTTYVAQSKNDGYTLLFAGAGAFAIAPHQIKDIAYKNADFQPISMVSTISQGFIINTDVIPVQNLAEFLAYVKARPGKFTYGTSGTGGGQHLVGERIKEETGIDITQVGYRGSPEVLRDLLGGQIGITVDGLVAYLPRLAPNGPLRAIAINSRERLAAAPDVPTFAELGYPQLTSESWGGILAPAGTPRAIVNKLHEAIVQANKTEDIQTRVIRDGATPLTTTPEEFARVMDSDYQKFGSIIRKLNIKPQ